MRGIFESNLAGTEAKLSLNPLRYPGGKRWFIKHAVNLLRAQQMPPELFIEAFVGGGTVGLTLLVRGLIRHLLIVERDPRVAAFWRRALTDPSFADTVAAFKCTRANVEATLIDSSPENRAFWTLVKNRCGFGGNLDGGLMREIAGRWNGTKLAATLRLIYSMTERITFVEGDGIEVLKQYSQRKDAIAFCDPPYTAETISAGHKLYRYAKLDHEALFRVLRTWSGRWVATYDDNATIRKIVRGQRLVARGVKMRTNHHLAKYELVIGKDLKWLPDQESVPLGLLAH